MIYYCDYPLCKKQLPHRKPYEIKRSKRHYCNTLCQNANDKLRGINKTYKANQSVRENGLPKRKGKPASWINGENRDIIRKKISEAKLKNNWMKGRFTKDHHGYRGGKVLYRGWDWKDQKRLAKERDNYCCVKCGISEQDHIKLTGQVLQVDHIIPYRVSKDNNLDNLQTLCCKCHGAKEKEEYETYGIINEGMFSFAGQSE